MISIYIIQYPKYGNEQKGAVSYGILNGILDEYNIIYNCNTNEGSSGSPILKLSNKKIIGIHKGGSSIKEYNKGTILKYPIKEYLNKINNENNEIKLVVKIEKEDINKDIYFLDNIAIKNYIHFDDDDEEHNDNNNLKELNELNTEIFINNIKYKYTKNFKPEKEGLYEIKIKMNILIKDCSYMFYGCSNLTNIDFSSFNTENVNDMSFMFSFCYNITITKHIAHISNIFSIKRR